MTVSLCFSTLLGLYLVAWDVSFQNYLADTFFGGLTWWCNNFRGLKIRPVEGVGFTSPNGAPNSSPTPNFIFFFHVYIAETPNAKRLTPCKMNMKLFTQVCCCLIHAIEVKVPLNLHPFLYFSTSNIKFELHLTHPKTSSR